MLAHSNRGVRTKVFNFTLFYLCRDTKQRQKKRNNSVELKNKTFKDKYLMSPIRFYFVFRFSTYVCDRVDCDSLVRMGRWNIRNRRVQPVYLRVNLHIHWLSNFGLLHNAYSRWTPVCLKFRLWNSPFIHLYTYLDGRRRRELTTVKQLYVLFLVELVLPLHNILFLCFYPLM